MTSEAVEGLLKLIDGSIFQWPNSNVNFLSDLEIVDLHGLRGRSRPFFEKCGFNTFEGCRLGDLKGFLTS